MTRHGPGPLPVAIRRRIWWRSLMLQASWNHQRMQALGLLHVLGAWADWRTLAPDERRRLARRHLGFFNTNPYLAPYLLGGLMRLEDDRLRGDDLPESLLAGFRDTLSRACGALGDQLTWLGGRPLAMLLAVLAAGLAGWGGVLIVLALGAAGQLALRWRALGRGWSLGLEVISEFERRAWYRTIGWLGRLGLILTGLLAGYFFAAGQASGQPHGSWRLTAVVVIGLAVAVIPARRHTCEAQFLVGMALLSIIGLVF